MGVALDPTRPQARSRYAAVDELYREHGPQALRLAYLLIGDNRAAEDIVHDAFVRLIGRLRSIRDPGALRAYLNRAVVNLAKNYKRGAARLREHVERSGTPAPEMLPDFGERDEIHRRLLELPYRQRAALVLRYCEDLSETDVADALKTSPKAVRSLVGRGISTLRGSNERNTDD